MTLFPFYDHRGYQTDRAGHIISLRRVPQPEEGHGHEACDCVGLLVSVPAIAGGQSQDTGGVSRTACGDPDLQGTWTNTTTTPLPTA